MQELQLFIVAFLLQKALVSLELAEVKVRHFDSDAANFFFFLLQLFLGFSNVVFEFGHGLLIVVVVWVRSYRWRLIWCLAGSCSVHVLLPTNHILHKISLLIHLLLLLISVEFAPRCTRLSWFLSVGSSLLQLQLMRGSNLILINRKLHPWVLLRRNTLKSEGYLIIQPRLLLDLVLKHSQL